MTSYGHELQFGAFITPSATPPHHAVDLSIVAEHADLDLATFQDHPYQAQFLDTWTLLAYVASRTSRIRLSGNVLNLPLRDPAMLAKSVASLDLLSKGRIELGIGAGGFQDAIVSLGGPRLSPGQSVEALEEGIDVIREFWDTGTRGEIRYEGSYYRIKGAKRGPAPFHEISIWIGAYKPRMLALTGRKADGWLPSLMYLPGGPSDLTAMNALIDAAAIEAGRNPASIRRMLNIGGRFDQSEQGLLQGPPAMWARQLAEIHHDYGISTFLLAADDPASIQRFGSDVAPMARELARR